jgi:hypothetical protein
MRGKQRLPKARDLEHFAQICKLAVGVKRVKICGFFDSSDLGTECSKDGLGLQVLATIKRRLIHPLPQ